MAGNMKKIMTLASICMTVSLSSGAQTLKNLDRYMMNEKLINLVCDYELYSVFPGGSDSEYLSLFSKDAKVYCDYFSCTGFQCSWTPEQYSEYSLSSIESLRVRIKNVKKQDYVWNGGGWTVDLTFDKEISYVDGNKQFFSVKGGTMDEDVHITMSCVYSETDGRFYIYRVDGTYNGDDFGDRFFVIKKTCRYDEESLLCNGTRLGFTEDREAVLVSGGSRFSTDDEDLRLKSNVRKTSDRYDVVTFDYKPVCFRIGARGGFAPVMAYGITSEIDFDKTKSSAYEAGVDFAYLSRLNRRHRIGVGTGLGVSFSSLSMSASQVEYALTLDDESFTPYSRIYRLNNVSEGIRFTDMVLPAYLAYECRIARIVSFSFDAGFKLYLNMDTKVVPYEIDGYVEKDYGGGTAVEKTDISGTYDAYMVPVSYRRNTYDVSSFARTGVDALLGRSLVLSFLVGYEYGITESYKSDRSTWFSPETGDYPLIYSNKSHSDQAVRSFADCISYRRNAIWFELGMKLKF